MKRKIKKEKNKIMKVKKIKLSNKIRLTIVGIFVIILLISLISLANAYQKPIKTQIEVSTLKYDQVGNYNYIGYISESLVYEGKQTLRPGEGIVFRDLTKSINGTFTYRLDTNQISEISGTYTITAQITTDVWIKTYTIVSETSFNSSGTTAFFTEQFPIDYIFFENITSQIEKETGVTVKDPLLVITTNIVIIIDADGEIIYETLKPSLSVILNKPTINIEFGTENQESGEGIPIIQEDTNQDVINERNMWTASSLIFIIPLILLIGLTKSSKDLIKTGKTNKKIMKKYKEWIVDVTKEPKRVMTDTIKLNSFEDLFKISEELGKPILHYSKDQDSHNYYVLVESINYEYNLLNIL